MFDVAHLIQVGGLLAIALVVFGESGTLLGIILPGDTLLITAGLFAGQNKLPLGWLLVIVAISAIVGYEVGYAFGQRLGPKVFKRKDGILLRKDYIDRTRIFLEKYGPITLITARFIAHVRTFVSMIAGASEMDRKVFSTCNVIGAVLWSFSLILIGFWLGNNIPNIDRYFFPALVGGLILIYVTATWGLIKSPTRRKALKQGLKEDWEYYFRSRVKS